MGDALATGLAAVGAPRHRRSDADIGLKRATMLAVERTRASSTACGVRAARAVLLGAVLALLASCSTPTLPLPPPTEPSITASSIPSKVHLHGVQSVASNALVIAFNQNPAIARTDRVTGTQADAAGTWDMDVTASPKDVIEITQETGDTRSPSIDVTVPAAK